jgi:hypothetical protein
VLLGCRTLDGEQFDLVLPTAQLGSAEAGRAVSGQRGDAANELAREKQRLLELFAGLLDARGRVDRVAEIDDLALVVAALAGNDGPAVQTDTESRNASEVALVQG